MKFIEVISGWVNRYFSNEEAIFLVLLLVGSMIVLATIGSYLAPILTGLVFAFLLQGLVSRLEAVTPPDMGIAFVIEIGALVVGTLYTDQVKSLDLQAISNP